MKKCISFLVAILLCFQFSFTCYSYANGVETVNPKTETIKEYSLEYEPKLALDGGEDGLKFYKIIIDQAHKYLKENGIILL